jgi:two-component system cell cycle response regulator CtrA
MRVLLIEDDSATAQSIELMLKSEGFNVYTTDLGEEGVDLGKLYDYDIILLDLNLPDVSGFEVLRTLRISKVRTPILILSGLAGIEDKCKGLGFGADDYITKPFHKDALVARVHAIVRRSKGHAQSVPFGGLQWCHLRLATATAWRPERLAGLTLRAPRRCRPRPNRANGSPP